MRASTSSASSRRRTARSTNGQVTDEVEFYSALQEEGHNIAPGEHAASTRRASSPTPTVSSRHNGDFVMAKPEDVKLMDVSPNQLVSVAASLIPFLENDDANRALMGSNMQRQAVPLIQHRGAAHRHRHRGHRRPRLRRHAGRQARRRGRVGRRGAHRRSPDRERAADPLSAKPDIYNLIKYQRSNQNTCINQKPIVQRGDKVQGRATSSPTVRPPSRASWRSART